MSDFSFRSNKGEILDSMFRQPETAKLIRDSLNSPLGSTSRAKARNVFSIMSKLNDHNNTLEQENIDSQAQTQPQDYNQQENINNYPKGMVVFNKIPKARITYGNIPKTPQTISPNPQSLPNIINSNTGMNRSIFFDPNNASNNSGMGGPGNDGRGGFLNSIWNGFQNLGKANRDFRENGFKYNPNTMTDIGSFWNNTKNNVKSGFQNLGKSNREFRENGFRAFNPAPEVANASDNTSNNNNQNNNQPIFDNNQPNNNNNQWNPRTPTSNPIETSNPQSSFSNPTPVVNNGIADWSQTPVKPTTEQVAYWNKPKNENPPVNLNQNTSSNNVGSSSSLGKGTSRMDRNNNPTAFTTDIAKQAGLVPGVDYEDTGDTFDNNGDGTIDGTTAKLLGNPIDTTIKVIDKIGFTTDNGANRWTYTDSIPGANNSDWAKMTKEQKTIVIGQMYQHEGGGASDLTNNTKEAQQYISAHAGPVNFGLNATKEKMGSLQDVIDKNRNDIFSKYNINEQRSAIQRLEDEGITLPKDITDYIKGRDTYLKQTDAEINNVLSNAMTQTDMSDPLNAAKVNAQLNYLYTLRGRQNQSYIGYLNDSIEQHNNFLKTKITKYNSDLAFASSELKNANSISVSEYNNMMKGFEDMYSELKNAPLEAMKLEATSIELGEARKKAAEEGVNQVVAKSVVEQAKELHPLFYDNDNHLMINLDLAQKIIQMSKDPANKDINAAGMVKTYELAVEKYLSSVPDKKNGITSEKKMSLLKNAIKNFEKLSLITTSIGPDGEKNQQGLNYLEQADLYKKKLKADIASQILQSDQIDGIKESIKDSPNNWNWFWMRDKFGTSLKPEDDFVSDIEGKTNGAITDSMAKAIYEAIGFATNNGNNKDGRNAFFYPTSDISNSSNTSVYDFNNPFTDVQFANNIAEIISQSPLSNDENNGQ